MGEAKPSQDDQRAADMAAAFYPFKAVADLFERAGRKFDPPAYFTCDCGCLVSAGDIPCDPEHGRCPLAEFYL